MRNKTANPEGDGWSEMEPHDSFLELCALSTSGDLTEEEQKTLQGHLAECPECRQALKEFEAAAGIGIPLLHPHLDGSDSLESSSVFLESAGVRASGVTSPLEPEHTDGNLIEQNSRLGFPHR